MVVFLLSARSVSIERFTCLFRVIIIFTTYYFSMRIKRSSMCLYILYQVSRRFVRLICIRIWTLFFMIKFYGFILQTTFCALQWNQGAINWMWIILRCSMLFSKQNTRSEWNLNTTKSLWFVRVNDYKFTRPKWSEMKHVTKKKLKIKFKWQIAIFKCIANMFWMLVWQ